ncbi:hypothetical protein ARALYDRAFT_901059 [Arabidopsis lyrata subsp. lyrata]|uniref:TF-B3 domain-containing protein n=1 Tax=Arabidopsis lyrata subsp. lyrata TaxID=81972 RepID=D7LIX2_ARALL|nr:hypothetical protein ARALYDRAFT_901059 [Arabidopsis lyrata subsp. lyrata]
MANQHFFKTLLPGFHSHLFRHEQPRKKKKEVESSLYLSCFVANVTPSNLGYDSLNLPLSFVRANGVYKRCGDMILMNEKGRSWTVVSVMRMKLIYPLW